MDQATIDKYRKAGKILAETLDYGKRLIVPGAKLLDVTVAVEKKILELGGNFAFPPQISLNSVAAHYCSPHDDMTVFKKGDLVKLDCGVHIDGFVADSAVTVDLGDNKELVEASQYALEQALAIIKPGVTLGEIGRTIQEAIESRGFKPIRNLSGHGLNRYVIHDGPSIPNFDTNDDTALEEDQVIAIEPFATTGGGMVSESGRATIFSLVGKRPVRSPFTKEVLKHINDEGLPFSERELILKTSPGKVAFALRELKQLGVLHEYPPLKEKSEGLVSQAEHSVIVREKPIVFTRVD